MVSQGKWVAEEFREETGHNYRHTGLKLCLDQQFLLWKVSTGSKHSRWVNKCVSCIWQRQNQRKDSVLQCTRKAVFIYAFLALLMLESSNKSASRNGGERKSSATKQTPLQQQLHLAGL